MKTAPAKTTPGCLIIKGPQDAINHGINLSSGEIVAWLNSDDIYYPGSLQKVTEIFSRFPRCQWLYGNCPIIDADEQEIRRAITRYKEFIGYVFSRNILLCENFINQPATFWRKSLWQKVTALELKYKAAWDYELWLRMLEAGGRPRHIHSNLAAFRRHDGSISENHFETQFHEGLEIAGRYGNFLHRIVHWLNIHKIIIIYKLLAEKKGSS